MCSIPITVNSGRIKVGKNDATREEIISAAKSAQCHEFIEKLENGYDTIVLQLVQLILSVLMHRELMLKHINRQAEWME